MAEQYILCPICNDWFVFEGSVLIPPDVQGHKSACGHVLSLSAEMTEPEVEQVEPEDQQEEPTGLGPERQQRKRRNLFN